MNQDIIIPWRDAGCIYRRRHFEYLYDYYSQQYNVIVGDNDGEFNRSAARNNGVEQSTSDVVVVIDADNYIPFDQIEYSIRMAKRRNNMVKPFQSFGYLTEKSTDYFYENGKFEEEPEFIGFSAHGFNGGAYVLKKELWLKVGGMDENFIGWGAEDDAFHILCKAKLGKTSYVHGYDYHLYHPAHRVTSKKNYDYLQINYVRNKKL